MSSETTSCPANWTRSAAPDGLELTFALRKWILGLVLGGGIILVFGYGVSSFLAGWFIDHEEILPAGVVLCLVLLGGVAAGVYVVDRLIFTQVTYRLLPATLSVCTRSLIRNATTTIDRANVKEVLQSFTRRVTDKGQADDTWRTIVKHQPAGGGDTKELVCEGWTEAETCWLAPLMAKWADVPLREEEKIVNVDDRNR